jgi:hypothetical protein
MLVLDLEHLRESAKNNIKYSDILAGATQLVRDGKVCRVVDSKVILHFTIEDDTLSEEEALEFFNSMSIEPVYQTVYHVLLGNSEVVEIVDGSCSHCDGEEPCLYWFAAQIEEEQYTEKQLN